MAETSEITSILGSLETFYGQHASYLQGTGPLPAYPAILNNMGYADLVTFCMVSANKGSSFDIGVIQEVVSTAEAVLRETDILSLRKSEIYSAHSGECETEETFYRQSKIYSLGVFKGSPTQGSQT